MSDESFLALAMIVVILMLYGDPSLIESLAQRMRECW